MRHACAHWHVWTHLDSCTTICSYICEIHWGTHSDVLLAPRYILLALRHTRKNQLKKEWQSPRETDLNTSMWHTHRVQTALCRKCPTHRVNNVCLSLSRYDREPATAGGLPSVFSGPFYPEIRLERSMNSVIKWMLKIFCSRLKRLRSEPSDVS